VLGEIDDAHPAGAEQPHDPVVSDLAIDEGRTFSSASSRTASGASVFFLSAMVASAPYTISSARDFLPRSMILLMNLASSSDLNVGSGRMVRISGLRRRDMA
jgi:hypothetical protein